MAIKIPQYNQQVGLSTPRVSSVTAPDSSLVLNSMNKQYAANASLAKGAGDIASVVAKHAQEQQELKNDQQVSQVLTQYSQDKQGRYFDKNMEAVKVNGQDVTRPKGLMYRSLGQANGALVESDEWYMSSKSKYLDQVKSPTHRAKLELMMDKDYQSSRLSVNKHEAAEWRKDLVNTSKSALKMQIENAYGADREDSLNTAIENGVLTADALNKAAAYDEVTAAVSLQDTTSKIVENSVLGKLRKTGDVAQAEALLETVKDKVTEKTYEGLKSKISEAGKNIAKQAEVNSKLVTLKNESQLLDEISSGNVTWLNSSDIGKSVAAGEISQEFGQAAIKYIDSPQSIDATGDEDSEAYIKSVKEIFNAKDKQSLRSALVNVLNGGSDGRISKDDIAFIFKAAKERGDSLSGIDKPGAYAPGSKQPIIDAGMKSVIDWAEKSNIGKPSGVIRDYLSALESTDNNPKDAYNIAINSAVLQRNPALISLPDIPNETLNSGGTVQANIPGMRNIKPDNNVSSKASYKVMQDKKTGARARVYADGRIEVIK